MLSSWKSARLETSGPSTLPASWVTGNVGVTTDFTLHQGGEACNGVLRPHRVTVSTWHVVARAFERTHVFSVRIDGGNASIDPEGVVAVPGDATSIDLVIANDGDLTYAISRLDEHPTDITLAHVGTIDVVITRTVIWASLWNVVRDGLLDLCRFVVTVLNAIPSKTEPVIRDRLLLFVAEAISFFLPGQARPDAHDQVLVTTVRLSREAEDSGVQRSYTRAFTAEFAAHGGDEREATVRDFASSDNPDTTWRVCHALAARGLVDAESIEARRSADGSGEAARTSVKAPASPPLEEVRMRAWELVLSDSLSNNYPTAALASLQASSWESETEIESAVGRMIPCWEGRTIGMAPRYANGVLALGVDVDRDGGVRRSVGLLRCQIDEHVDAPAWLRRIVVKHLDSFKRDERAQRRWSSGR